MKLLVIGNGGREHALVWKLSKSPNVNKIYVASGNYGTSKEKKTENINISLISINLLAEFAKKNSIDLTIVGSELPLSLGIVDYFILCGLRCLGPTQYCAQLESSKVFSKQFMFKHNIPTAIYKSFSNKQFAEAYLDIVIFPIVIKVDGLAAGKGVVISYNKEEAKLTIKSMFTDFNCDNIKNSIIIEEFLEGDEASFIVLCDGKIAIPMASSKDHKTIYNNNKGPNTGGMGAYSPSKIITTSIHNQAMKTVIQPVLKGMLMSCTYYKGFLYAGLMVLPNGLLKVLEFNCRFGDPETQPIMLRLKSDFALLCLSAVYGVLDNVNISWDNRVSLGVVMASKGYPETYSNNKIILGLGQDDNGATVKIFHAGTKIDKCNIVTNGGRVLCVTALGSTLLEARKTAYDLVSTITWSEEYYRTDIGVL